MEYKKSIIIIILAVFLISIASVSASDANETAIVSGDTVTIEISQNEEINLNDNNQVIGQSNDEELISQGNTGTFTELYNNINATSQYSTLELDRNYEYDYGFDTNGIPINKTITIDGKGYTINAKGQGRVFNIQASDVVIKNLNIINAKVTNGDGGAIYFAQSGRAIYCNFTNNEANGPRSSGGAMYFLNGGDITNCNFAYNTAKYEGGAVSFYNTSTVTNCSFINNELPNCDGSGGAIYLRDGSIKNCKFINNSVSDNEPYISYSGSGGAIWTFFANIENCNFTNNTATGGCGAIDSNYGGYVTNCNFINNKAINGDSSTGALFLARGNVTNCNFINNSAGYSAGAINTNYDLHVINCNFTNNKVTGDASMAGAISMGEGSIENCNFINNSAADDAGAIYAAKSRVENCNFINNHVSRNMSRGGAISMLFSNVTNCNFTNNTANGDGGAIHADEGSIENCSFTNNRVTDDNSFGGAVYLEKSNVINCSFTNNTACDGGAVYLNGGNVANCSFTNNKVIAHYVYSVSLGGAIYFVNSGTVTTCKFINNKIISFYPRMEGGAIYGNHQHVIADTCIFKTEFDTNQDVIILPPTLNVDNFTSFYGSGEKITFDLKTNSSIPVTNGNISISVYSKDNNRWVGNYSCLSGEGWIPDLPVGYYYAIFNTEYAEFKPINRTVTVVSDNTFLALNYTINGNDNSVIELSHDFYFDPTCDAAFKNGINIQRSVTIKGNGFVIDAKGQAGIFTLLSDNIVIENLTLKNAHTGYGGAVSFFRDGKVRNCNFVNNSANSQGGAVYFFKNGELTNCNFADNTATDGGAVFFEDNGKVINCNFTGNNATAGSAIYFSDTLTTSTVSNSIFLNNRANAETLNVVKNDNNITITFTGQNNLLNAIYSQKDVIFSNVTYWSARGITNTDILVPVKFKNEAGQNIFVGVVVNDVLILNDVKFTDENGMIVLDISAGENYYILVRHDTDSYYTEAEKTISNNINVNVTSLATNNKTVNITAESNIYSEVMPGKLLFILPDGTEINATYGANGIWWSEYAFDDYGVYQVNASYVGLDNVIINNGTIEVTPPEHTFWFLNYTINGNDNPVIELSNDFYFDPIYDAAFVNGVVINRPVTIKGNGVVIDAKGQARIFDVRLADTIIENLTFKNANYNSGNGGAIYFASSGIVSNCTFTGNTAYEGGAVYFTGAGIVSNCTFTGNTARWHGGALRFRYSSTVSNCNFTGNTATGSGGAIYSLSGTLTNCNFTGNTATGSGGAIMFVSSTTVSNCNFNDNSASSGGAVWMSYGGVSNSNFIGNNATTGSAIYFGSASTLSNSILLNNKADAEALDMVKNDDNITITFTGRNNLLNAIYSEGNVTFTDVTYWGANGIATVSATMSGSNKVAGQNVTVEVVVNGVLVLNDVYVTDENGTIVLENMNLDGNYFITVRHDDDSYYTGAETILTNMELHANVTSIATNNRTVNLTAKSNIYGGKFQFVLSDGTKIDANYASNGIWWAVYTFDDYAEYNVSASYLESGNVAVSNGTITITKADSEITLDKTVFDYGDSINVATMGAVGITAKIDGNDVTVVDFTIPLSGLNAGTYNLAVTTIPDEDHNPVTVNATITINKLQTVLTGNAVTAVYNINKDLVITLKDSNGKALSGVSVTVDLNGAKTYATDKNGQVKVSTKGLAPKAYTAKVTFNGNTKYAKSTKDIKVTVKKATPKMKAKKKTFKRTVKTKKYTIVLRDNTGKAMKKVKVTLKIKGKKTITVKTNSKGKATFKIKKLTKKGTYKSTVTYKGNKYYNKVTKKVKIKVK